MEKREGIQYHNSGLEQSAWFIQTTNKATC